MDSELEAIRQNVVRCTNCDLCKTRTNAVPGKGNFQSDVVFVGEAPGRNEDQRGEPFVGVAGKRLDHVLESAGISRDSVYITNVVKCRPPNNRVPSVAERDTCKEYLQKEISIIKPKVICVLGNTAFNSVLGGAEITKFRGKIVRKDNQIYFLTVHPAATIYNQELIGVLESDIAKLFETVKELKNNRQVKIDIEYDS
ncbi:MAG: uracil-DNA glycosylase [Nitrosarchaeum sp.]|nr:uracil-DNA glycosylase [Nitrosarchaeum sp.]